MAIAIHNIDGRGCPVVLCDHCEQRIHKADDGVYLWKNDDLDHVYFAHQGKCHDFLEAKFKGHAWMHLETLLVYLRRNLGVDMKLAEERVNRLDGLAP